MMALDGQEQEPLDDENDKKVKEGGGAGEAGKADEPNGDTGAAATKAERRARPRPRKSVAAMAAPGAWSSSPVLRSGLGLPNGSSSGGLPLAEAIRAAVALPRQPPLVVDTSSASAFSSLVLAALEKSNDEESEAFVLAGFRRAVTAEEAKHKLVEKLLAEQPQSSSSSSSTTSAALVPAAVGSKRGREKDGKRDSNGDINCGPLLAEAKISASEEMAACLLRAYGADSCFTSEVQRAAAKAELPALLSLDDGEQLLAPPPAAKRQRREEGALQTNEATDTNHTSLALFRLLGARTSLSPSSPASAYLPLARAILDGLRARGTQLPTEDASLASSSSACSSSSSPPTLLLLPVLSSRLLVAKSVLEPHLYRPVGANKGGRVNEVRRCLDCARAYHDNSRCRPATAAVNPYALLCHKHCTNPLPGEAGDEAEEHLKELGLSKQDLLAFSNDGADHDEDSLIAAAAAAAAAKGGSNDGNGIGGVLNTQALLAASSAGGVASGFLLQLLQATASSAAKQGKPATSISALNERSLTTGRSISSKLDRLGERLDKLALVPQQGGALFGLSQADPRHFRLWTSWAAELDTRMPVWTKISKNIYVAKVRPQREDEDTDLCTCAKTSKTFSADGKTRICDEDCFNRSVRVECRGAAPTSGAGAGGSSNSARNDRANCSIGPHCTNRALQLRQLPPLDLVPTPGKGWGVRAGADIPEGGFVIEYVGEIIDEAMQEERLEQCKQEGETHYYLMEIDANQIIDARHKSNLARFINHSCDPNAELQRWSVDGYTRIGIFAIRDIAKGEEISYDYKFFSSELTRCACGTAKCRGYLGVNVAKEEAERKAKAAEAEKAKRRAAAQKAAAIRAAKPKKAAAEADSAASSSSSSSSSAPAGEGEAAAAPAQEAAEGASSAEGVAASC